MKINIIILNYNGKELLEECLPGVLDAVKVSEYECVVSVLDNQSTDGSVIFLRQMFPSVKIYIAKVNKVYCSYNSILSEIGEELVVLLNNDMKVEKDFLTPLVEVFRGNENVFAVGPKCLDFSKTRYEGTMAKPFFRLGVLSAIPRYRGYEKYVDRQGLTVQIAFGLFDRRKLLLLGGFDELYLPGIMEDMDICYRAYKYGFRCYYQPKSVVYHKGQVSFKKVYTTRYRLAIAHRNSFLFMWKNITDPVILVTHILLIPIKLFFSLMRLKIETSLGLFLAIKKLKYALMRRKEAKKFFNKTDRQVLKDIENNFK
ncbi:MAG: glycosyltransferase family 2 protein [Candidatus Omnitrophota bacterium]|jgi:GT2 family glycosyltransferase